VGLKDLEFRVQAMRRYLPPGLLMLASPLLAWALSAMDAFASYAPLVAPVGYAAGAVWWVARATRPARPAWPHLIALWIVAAPPIALAAPLLDDDGALAGLAMLPYAAAAVFVSLVGTFVFIGRNTFAET
jgi:hypothetical protein